MSQAISLYSIATTIEALEDLPGIGKRRNWGAGVSQKRMISLANSLRGETVPEILAKASFLVKMLTILLPAMDFSIRLPDDCHLAAASIAFENTCPVGNCRKRRNNQTRRGWSRIFGSAIGKKRRSVSSTRRA